MLSRDQVRGLMPREAEQNEWEAYNYIRDECMKRIETIASDGKECCVYVVSPIHFGLPVYDPQEVFERLYGELHARGFQLVAWPISRRLLISWFVDEETTVSNLKSAFYKEEETEQGDTISSNVDILPQN